MLDLKAKLASAGLVDKDDIERVEKQKKAARAKRGKGRGGRGNEPGRKLPKLPVKELKLGNKGELYDAVRRWVAKVRLDPAGGAPPEDAKPFHFAQASGKVGRLMLSPALVSGLEKGESGLVAFMSNHGLAHAVVPADAARNLADVKPLWLRVLRGDDRAGQLEERESNSSSDK